MNSEYIKVVNKGLPTTLIVFSSAGIPAGKFSGSNLFADFEGNLIFINAPNNNWFIGGIEGIGSNVEEITLQLSKVLTSLNTSKLFTYGGSMGGYGAILYGKLLHANKVFATGVETTLGIKGGFFNKHCQVNVSTLDQRYLSLKSVLGSTDDNCILCLYGELSHVDIESAYELKVNSNIQLLTLRNEDHSLPPFLNFHFNFKEIVLSYFYGVECIALKGLQGNILENYALSNAIYRYKYFQHNIQKDIESEINVENISKVNMSYGLFYLGVIARKNREHEKAFNYFNNANSYNDSNFVCLYNLAEQSVEMKKYELAEHYARRALSFLIPGFRPLYNASFALLISLIHQNKINEAEIELNNLNNRLTQSARKNPHIDLKLKKVNKLLKSAISKSNVYLNSKL